MHTFSHTHTTLQYNYRSLDYEHSGGRECLLVMLKSPIPERIPEHRMISMYISLTKQGGFHVYGYDNFKYHLYILLLI